MARILLIESNAVLANTYKQALQIEGHVVDRVAGAQAAIDVADANMPDVVLLELHLSAHSGIEFLHEFRSYPEWQHIPVIINTAVQPAKIAPVRQVLAEDFGVRDVLYKPKASLEDILRAVREQLVAT